VEEGMTARSVEMLAWSGCPSHPEAQRQMRAILDDLGLPDVAIEVTWTSGGIDKLDVYRKLGVREVWYWEDGCLQVHMLRGTHYEPVARSEALVGIDLDQLVGFLDRPTASQAIRDYVAALRGDSSR